MTPGQERMTIEPASDGRMLVTIEYAWSHEERVTFTVAVHRGNWSVAQLRQKALATLIGALPRQAEATGTDA